MSLKKVYFVRHGETEGNLANYFQGPEDPLTEFGHKGAEAVAGRFAHLQVDELIVSPFKRAQQTAKYIATIVNKPIITFDAFHECMHPLAVRDKEFDGEEGKAHLDAYEKNFCDPQWKPEGAENFHDVKERMDLCITLIQESIHENIVVVTHGLFLRRFAAYLLLGQSANAESNWIVSSHFKTMSNVGITEFIIENENWKLRTWNDCAHFAE